MQTSHECFRAIILVPNHYYELLDIQIIKIGSISALILTSPSLICLTAYKLDVHKTLREQGINESQVLILRNRLHDINRKYTQVHVCICMYMLL